MNRPVRRLVLLGVAAGGAWVLRRALVERSERAARRRAWLTTETKPVALPAAPLLTDADTLRATATPEAVPAGPLEVTSVLGTPPAPASVEESTAPVPVSPVPVADMPVAATPVAPVPVATAPVAPTPTAPAPATEPPVVDEAPAVIEAPAAGASAPLDLVRERLAALNVDGPAVRATTDTDRKTPARPRRTRKESRWTVPDDAGGCGDAHPIKVKLRSGLFHLPGMLAYDRTRADRCYRSADEAVADGFERAKR